MIYSLGPVITMFFIIVRASICVVNQLLEAFIILPPSRIRLPIILDMMKIGLQE